MSPDSPPAAQEASPPSSGSPSSSQPSGPGRGRLLPVAGGLVAVLTLAGVLAAGLLGGGLLDGEPSPDSPPAPTATATNASPSGDPAGERAAAVTRLLAERAAAVRNGDVDAWLDQVDPTQEDFRAAQERVIRRLVDLAFVEWDYQLVGDGPPLAEERAAALPDGSAIVRVRLSYRLEGTETRTDREQYLTVAPRGGRWLLAGDTDAEASGLRTQRDLWDLGPVRLVRGAHVSVLAGRGAPLAEVERLAREADEAVEDVDVVWRQEWGRRAVVLLPHSQQDMATLIGGDGKGLGQIAAVTTGEFEDGLARGDRVVINPEAFGTLGAQGRAVVLTHELTHVATRASTVIAPPIWLSEGFADYVAYRATPVEVGIVAADLLEEVRDGALPERLPEAADFDASEGDIAVAYEAAWMAARMLAERHGERDLVRLYEQLTDSAGPGWPQEAESVLGITEDQLTRQWRAYLRQVARA